MVEIRKNFKISFKGCLPTEFFEFVILIVLVQGIEIRLTAAFEGMFLMTLYSMSEFLGPDHQTEHKVTPPREVFALLYLWELKMGNIFSLM